MTALVTRFEAAATLGQRFLAASGLATATVLAAGIRPAVVRGEAFAMVVIVVAVAWTSRRPTIFGPVAASRSARLVNVAGFAVIATAGLLFINGLRVSPHGLDVGHATTLTAIWTVLLPMFPQWVANNAPPVYPIGVWIVGGLAAATLSTMIRITRPNPDRA
jgi:hypothetical protein